jgi:hypothetical protein
MQRLRERRHGVPAFLLLALLLGAGPSSAVTYELFAETVTRTLDGEVVEMWGLGQISPSAKPASVPGPVLDVPAGEDLIVVLNNDLDVPISLVVPGLGLGAAPAPVVDGDGRVQTFSAVEAPVGGSATYTFPATGRPGTYLYESGTDPALQIPMGLYGAVIVRPGTPQQAYDDGDGRSAFDAEQVLVLSEVDPDLNAAVAAGDFGTPAFPSTARYAPRYFLINGQTFHPSQPAIVLGPAGDTTMLRLVNAGSLTHAPTLGGIPLREVAQDANLLPFPQERLTSLLHAGQTLDAAIQNPPPGQYALWDRRLFVRGQSPGGMIKVLRTAVKSAGIGCGLGAELTLLLPALWLARRRRAALSLAVALLAVAPGAAPPAAAEETHDHHASPAATASDADALRERWGVEIVGIHLTAARQMVDFRYRVLDPVKAAPLLDRHNRAALIDVETGAVLSVPHAPKIGTLRQNTTNPRAGRVAFALFANPQMGIREGSRVTVTIGDFRAENLTVR